MLAQVWTYCVHERCWLATWGPGRVQCLEDLDHLSVLCFQPQLHFEDVFTQLLTEREGRWNDYLAVRELTADFLSFRASWSWPIWTEVDLTRQKRSQNRFCRGGTCLQRVIISQWPHRAAAPLTCWSVPSPPSACRWFPSGSGTETKRKTTDCSQTSLILPNKTLITP